MSQPENGAPGAAPAPAAPRRVAAMSGKKSFPGTSGVEKLKGYLREVPKLHDQLRQVIEALRATASSLQATTESVQRLVRQWEEEQRHARPQGTSDGATAVPLPGADAPAGPAASGAPGAVPAPPG